MIYLVYFANNYQQQTAMAYYQQHMFSIKSRATLANILAQIILINETNQSFRQAIANSNFFDSVALFRLLDKQEKGYLCEKDLQQIMGTSHRKLLTYAFSWIDFLKAGEVSRLEFTTFLLPRDNLELRQLMAQRIQHPQIHHSSQEKIFQQFSIFRQMILQIIRREMRIIELRRNLLGQPEYSARGALLAIDGNRHDWVSAEDLFKFLKNFGYQMSARQVQKLVETVNTGMDGKVSQQQLKWVVEGLEGSDREYLDKIKQTNKRKFLKRPVDFEQSFSKYRSKSKAKRDAEKRYEQQKYQNLMSRLHQVNQEQQKLDHSLLLKQRINIQTIQDHLRKQQLNLTIKRKLENQQREKQRAIRQAKYSLNNQIDAFLQKTASLTAESQLLARLQNRAVIKHDISQIQQTVMQSESTPAYSLRNRPNRLPSFGHVPEDSFQSTSRYNMIQQQPRSPLIGTHNVFSSVKNSNKLNESIKKHIESSDLYLQTAREMKQKIKREREIERKIHTQFAKEQLSNRYLQLKSKENLSKGSKQVTYKKPGLIRGTEQKMDLGLQSAYKNKSIIKYKPIQQKRHYESPEHEIVKESILDKLDLSTANKVEQ